MGGKGKKSNAPTVGGSPGKAPDFSPSTITTARREKREKNQGKKRERNGFATVFFPVRCTKNRKIVGRMFMGTHINPFSHNMGRREKKGKRKK